MKGGTDLGWWCLASIMTAELHIHIKDIKNRDEITLPNIVLNQTNRIIQYFVKDREALKAEYQIN